MQRGTILRPIAGGVFCLLLASMPATRCLFAAEPPAISLELISEKNAPIDASRRWYELLTGLGISGLQIHSGAGREPAVESRGTGRARSLHVTGILTSAGAVRLPGGNFTLRDQSRVRQWLRQLAEEGESITEPKGPLGLPKALEAQAAHDLATVVRTSTAQVSLAKLIRDVAPSLQHPIDIVPATVSTVTITDELKGFSIGTAIAIAARSGGLALQAVRSPEGQLRYVLTPQSEARHAWPIGKAEKNVDKVPELFDTITVEIVDRPASEALGAMRERLSAPMFYDHLSMAAKKIELASAKVKIPEKRWSYNRIIRTLLFQAGLTMELRSDENGKCFVWIYPLGS